METSDLQNTYPMTVVMATLGGPTLKRTIEQVNKGSIVPAELLVCIPEKEASCVADLSFANVRVLVTHCRGQVAQRSQGFRSASYDIVMQLDDDIIVDKNCLEHLLQTLIKHGPCAAVAPVLHESPSNKKFRMNNTIQKIYYFFMNGNEGHKMGTISKAGAEFACDAAKLQQGEYDVEWLPGGCVIHFRENLIKENFFPFSGKAYCEDLLHSYYLTKNGVKLKINANARCFLEDSPISVYRFKEFLNFIMADYRVRKYFVKLSSRSIWRMHFYYGAFVLNYLIKRLLINFKLAIF